MTARPRFLFDVDFSAGEKVEEAEPTVTLSAHTVALTDAEANGYRKGFAAAEAKGIAEAERAAQLTRERIAAALESIAGALANYQSGLRMLETRLEAESVEVAVAVAKKLVPELIAQEPFAELKALAVDCFMHLFAAPHVVVRVNDALYDEAREHLETIAKTRGFDGRLVVLAEPEIAPGDCRIEWADGGIVRDRAAVEKTIDEAVNRYITTRRGEAGLN
ncbi:MAG TPA: FliH/SctL family protein [Xanthobacteraceae bacterium]|jgi:flagellar assembly protein FliH|nr:FliH/SctL family protein [Xanthobacteraceae bacterium]